MSTERDRLVRERAYHLWEADGREPGRSDEYWARAESEVGSTAHRPAGKTKAASAPKAAPGKAAGSVATKVAKPSAATSAKVAPEPEAAKRRSPAKASPAAKT